MALSLDKKHKRDREIQLECDTHVKGEIICSIFTVCIVSNNNVDKCKLANTCMWAECTSGIVSAEINQ